MQATPVTNTSKGSERANSIVFTVIEEGPAFELKKNKNPGFQDGSLPRSGTYQTVDPDTLGRSKAERDNITNSTLGRGTKRGLAYNERTFRGSERIGRTESKLSHQY
jgi:hypothetical protein